MVYSLLNCMLCTGFWVGLLSTTVFNYTIITNVVGPQSIFLIRLFDASLISGLIWFLYLIQLNLEKNVSDHL
jgi:hypothetical protein